VGSADPQGVKKVVFGGPSIDKKLQEIRNDEQFDNMFAVRQYTKPLSLICYFVFLSIFQLIWTF